MFSNLFGFPINQESVLDLKLKESPSETDEPMVHYNITPDTLEKMVEARRQLEEAILKYEPVIEKLEELWETKVKYNYSRLSLTQLCITQYYHLSRPDGPGTVFSPIYYGNSTTFISTTAKSIKLITR